MIGSPLRQRGPRARLCAVVVVVVVTATEVAVNEYVDVWRG